MTGDVSPLTKLWWKGADVIAGVLTNTISAAIIAFIGWCLWGKMQRSRELRLDREKRISAYSDEEALEALRAAKELVKANRELLDKVADDILEATVKADSEPQDAFRKRIDFIYFQLERLIKKGIDIRGGTDFVTWWGLARIDDLRSLIDYIDPQFRAELVEKLSAVELPE